MEKLTSILVIAERCGSDLPLLKKAVELARRFGSQIELYTCDVENAADLCRAYDTAGVEKEWLERVFEGRGYLETLRKSVFAPDVQIFVDAMCDNRFHSAIARKVAACRPDLVMKCASKAHPTRRFTLDSVDWELMRSCPVTLLLMRGREWKDPPRFAAMVDVDERDSGLANVIMRTSDYLALGCHAELHVVYSERDSSDPQSARRAGELDRLSREYRVGKDQVHVLSGEPDKTLPAFAASMGCDVIAMGALTHRKGLTSLVGRLTGGFVEALNCDFLLVKTPAPARDELCSGTAESDYESEPAASHITSPRECTRRVGHMTSRVPEIEGTDWRPALRAKLLWLLVAKVMGLWLLWYVCFSASHRKAVDGEVAAARLAIPMVRSTSAAAPGPPWNNSLERSGD